MENWSSFFADLNLEAILALVVALLVGCAAGWFLHSLTCRQRLRELDESWRKRLIGMDSAGSKSSVRLKLATGAAEAGFPIEELEGIGKGFGSRLRAMDIVTTHDLLESCATSEAQQSVARRMDLEDFVVRKWVCMADLMRLSGVSGNHAELLEASGIHSVQQLGKQDPEKLFSTMAEVNENENRSLAVPKPSIVARWVQEAKLLPPKFDS